MKRNDRTANAIARQLTAIGCARYDIGIRNYHSELMMNREWCLAEVLNHLPWLKRMNAQGNDIYVRPAHNLHHGVVMIDDVSIDDIHAMKCDQREPAAVIETSPDNYQVWIKTTPRAIRPTTRSEVARQLAHDYNADPASADAYHYGRLAGFTNQKDFYTNKIGQQPWVLCRESSGCVATDGPNLIKHARALCDANAQQHLIDLSPSLQPNQTRSAVDEYRSEMASLTKRYSDLSRCDFIAAMKLFSKRGRSVGEITHAIRSESPKEHKDRQYYAKRTAERAAAAWQARLSPPRSGGGGV